MTKLAERTAIEAPVALSAEDAAKIRALVQRLVKQPLAPDPHLNVGPATAWPPTPSMPIGAVESTVVLAVMAYFASAAFAALGLV
jgi:hypothetical protein